MSFIPLNDKILFRQKVKTKTKGGLHLPSTAKGPIGRKPRPEDIMIGEVVQLPATGTDQSLWGVIDIGDTILCAAAKSVPLDIDDEVLFITEISYVVGIVEKVEKSAEDKRPKSSPKESIKEINPAEPQKPRYPGSAKARSN